MRQRASSVHAIQFGETPDPVKPGKQPVQSLGALCVAVATREEQRAARRYVKSSAPHYVKSSTTCCVKK